MRKEMRMEMHEMAEGIRQVFEAAGWDAGAPIGKEEAKPLEMTVRIEKILCTVLHEAHRRQAEETMEALSEGPERFYERPY